MNSDSDCSILFGEVVNIGLLSMSINMCLGLASDTLWLIGLPEESTLSFFESCFGIGQGTNFCLILIELLKHLLFTVLLQESFGCDPRTIDVINAWSQFIGLFDIRGIFGQPLSHSGNLDLLINLLFDIGVLWVVNMKLRSDVLGSLN